MERIRAKATKDISKLVELKDYESRLRALLDKIRHESLAKLKWYKGHMHKIAAIVAYHQARDEDAHVVLPEMCRELLRAISETPDDDPGHDLLGGHVDHVKYRSDNAGKDRTPGESDGTGT